MRTGCVIIRLPHTTSMGAGAGMMRQLVSSCACSELEATPWAMRVLRASGRAGAGGGGGGKSGARVVGIIGEVRLAVRRYGSHQGWYAACPCPALSCPCLSPAAAAAVLCGMEVTSSKPKLR